MYSVSRSVLYYVIGNISIKCVVLIFKSELLLILFMIIICRYSAIMN